MTHYEISLNDGSTDKVESATYSVDDGWVFFHGEKGEPTYAYPSARVDRIAVVAAPEPPRVTFQAASIPEDELADIEKRSRHFLGTAHCTVNFVPPSEKEMAGFAAHLKEAIKWGAR